MNREEELEYVKKHGLLANEGAAYADWHSYSLGATHMWSIRHGWQVANLVDERWRNHAIEYKHFSTYRHALTIDEAIKEVVRRQHDTI